MQGNTFAQRLTRAYYTQALKRTKQTHKSFVLSRSPPGLAFQCRDGVVLKDAYGETSLQQLRSRLEAHTRTRQWKIDASSKKSQQRYKQNYDRRVRETAAMVIRPAAFSFSLLSTVIVMRLYASRLSCGAGHTTNCFAILLLVMRLRYSTRWLVSSRTPRLLFPNTCAVLSLSFRFLNVFSRIASNNPIRSSSLQPDSAVDMASPFCSLSHAASLHLLLLGIALLLQLLPFTPL